MGWEALSSPGCTPLVGSSPGSSDWGLPQQMALSVCSGCRENSALSNGAREQTPGMWTDQRKTLCSCHKDTFRQEVKKKIAIPLGMRAGEWEGGSQQFNSAEGGGCGGQDSHKWRSRKKEWDDVILYTGTVTAMKSGHTQWSYSMPWTVSVTRDCFMVMLFRKSLRTLLTWKGPQGTFKNPLNGSIIPSRAKRAHTRSNLFKVTKPQCRIKKGVWIPITQWISRSRTQLHSMVSGQIF